MTLTDLLGLLVGRRQSILNIARSPSALWVGLLLVFSAAMAREYDRHWLVADWWHLLLPFGASVAMALVQFAIFWARRLPPSNATFVAAFTAFLACFWMTAPLAWLYAIPYERFLSEADAVAANLWTLGVVSVLRGLIICRVLQVLTDIPFWKALVVSLGPAQVVLTAAAIYSPVPVLDVMSGIRYTPAEQVIRNTAGLVLVETIYVGWAVMIAAIVATARIKPVFDRDRVLGGRNASRAAWALPIVVSLAFIAVLPWTQPPWQRAHRVDELMTSNQIDDALQLMASTPRDQFPPDWRPMPATSFYFDRPNLIDVLNKIGSLPVDAWPRRYFVSELQRSYLESEWGYYPEEMITDIDALLEQIAEGPALKQQFAERLTEIHKRHSLRYPATTQSTP